MRSWENLNSPGYLQYVYMTLAPMNYDLESQMTKYKINLVCGVKQTLGCSYLFIIIYIISYMIIMSFPFSDHSAKPTKQTKIQKQKQNKTKPGLGNCSLSDLAPANVPGKNNK